MLQFHSFSMGATRVMRVHGACVPGRQAARESRRVRYAAASTWIHVNGAARARAAARWGCDASGMSLAGTRKAFAVHPVARFIPDWRLS